MAYIVDTNVHLFAADQQRYPLKPVSGKLPPWASDRQHLTAEEFVDHMRQAGVHQAALAHPSLLYGYDNSYCLDSAERYPEHFVAIGAIDAGDEKAGELLGYLMNERKVGAVRFERRDRKDPEEWLVAPQILPFWEEAARTRICVSLPTLRMRDLPVLRKALERFPNVNVILRRMADAPAEDGPPYDGAKPLLDMASFPSLYLTFSHHNIDEAKKGKSTPQAFFETFISKFGAKRLMWASFFHGDAASTNAPYKGLVEREREELSFLGEGDRDAVMGEAARALFPSLAETIAK